MALDGYDPSDMVQLLKGLPVCPARDELQQLLVESNVDLAGFQFQLTGVTLQDANGGISEEYGFSVDYSSNTNIVIGFSLTGEHIPAGAYNLFDLYSYCWITNCDCRICNWKKNSIKSGRSL